MNSIGSVVSVKSEKDRNLSFCHVFFENSQNLTKYFGFLTSREIKKQLDKLKTLDIEWPIGNVNLHTNFNQGYCFQ